MSISERAFTYVMKHLPEPQLGTDISIFERVLHSIAASHAAHMPIPSIQAV